MDSNSTIRLATAEDLDLDEDENKMEDEEIVPFTPLQRATPPNTRSVK